MNLKNHHSEIIRCLNPELLAQCLQEIDELIRTSRVDQAVENAAWNRDMKEKLFKILLGKPPSTHRQFLQCLNDSDEHLGHDYLLSLLQGTFESNHFQCRISQRLEEQLKKCRPDLVQGIDVFSLSGYMYSAKLLTLSEFETLQSEYVTREVKITNLLSLLRTKGPRANYIFACCLKEETEHRTHKQLFQMLTADLSDEEIANFKWDFPRIGQSRKRKAENQLEVTVPKRLPDRIKAEGTLASEFYFKKVSLLRQYHLKGLWAKADEEVEGHLDKNDKVLQIAITLEKCTGWITRRYKSTKIVLEVGKMLQRCEDLPSTSNNVRFLKGRCHWALAKHFRYIGDIDEALENIQTAAEIQSGIECGEDAALTSYCHGCILLERLSKPERYSSSPKDRKRALDYLERSISYASNEQYGLDLSHPRIRLAQVYLGSSPSQPGNISDPDSISCAKNSLDAVEACVEKLEDRTRCIFYFTKSDLVYHSSVPEARRYALQALDIAEDKGFKTEKLSIQARLDRIDGSHMPAVAA